LRASSVKNVNKSDSRTHGREISVYNNHGIGIVSSGYSGRWTRSRNVVSSRGPAERDIISYSGLKRRGRVLQVVCSGVGGWRVRDTIYHIQGVRYTLRDVLKTSLQPGIAGRYRAVYRTHVYHTSPAIRTPCAYNSRPTIIIVIYVVAYNTYTRFP